MTLKNNNKLVSRPKTKDQSLSGRDTSPVLKRIGRPLSLELCLHCCDENFLAIIVECASLPSSLGPPREDQIQLHFGRFRGCVFKCRSPPVRFSCRFLVPAFAVGIMDQNCPGKWLLLLASWHQSATFIESLQVLEFEVLAGCDHPAL